MITNAGVVARSLLLLLPLCSLAPSTQASEVFALGGGLRAEGSSTYSWMFEYRYQLHDYFDASIGWINEGHVTNHHRDGITGQLWAKTPVVGNAFTFAAGVGPYAYFDTTNVSPNAPEIDAHGVGVIYSLAATWQPPGPWRVQLRGNRITTRNSIDSTAVLLGVGYQLDDLPTTDGRPGILAGMGDRQERSLGVMLGAAIVNSFDSDHSFAKSIEYRHGISRYLDWTVGWLNEGSEHLGRRNSLVTQLWAVRPVWDERARIEAGFGPLVVLDKYNNDVGIERLAGVLTVGASYRVTPNWRARATWSRVFADHPYDSDVLLVGAAYVF